MLGMVLLVPFILNFLLLHPSDESYTGTQLTHTPDTLVHRHAHSHPCLLTRTNSRTQDANLARRAMPIMPWQGGTGL